MKHSLIIYVILLLIPIHGHTQHPLFYQLTEKEGLPDYEFYDMMEDSKGFIWFACNNGLYRYNGKEFTHFSNPQKKGESIFGLAEDNQGRIWCHNINNQLLYIDNDQLTIFIDLDDYSNTLQLNDFVIKDSYIYIASNLGILRFHIQTKEFTIIDSHFNNQQGNYYVYLLAKIKDTIWYQKQYQKCNGDYDSKLIFYQNNQPFLLDDLDTRAYDILETKENIFLNISSERGKYSDLLFFDKKTKSFKPIKNLPQSLKNSRILDITEDNSGHFWISSSKGAIRCKIENTVLTELKTYFPGKFIGRTLQDHTGNYWIASFGDGVFVIPNLEIESYTIQNSSIETPKINSITIDNSGQLFYPIQMKGIGKLNIETNTFSTFKKFEMSSGNLYPRLQYHEDYKALVYYGSFPAKIFQKNKEMECFMFPSKAYSILPDSTFFFSEAHASGIVENAFLKKLKNKNKFSTPLMDTLHILHTLKNKRSYDNYYSTKNKTIYAADSDNLVAYDLQLHGTPITYNGNSIFTKQIIETKDGVIWVSSIHYGLLGIQDGVITEKYTKENGILSNYINTMKADGNNIWMMTKKGLQCLERKPNHPTNIITIDKNDGLITNQISDIEIWKDQLFLASQQGLIKLNKKANFKNEIPPNIYIESIDINEHSQTITDTYTVDYNQSLSVRFNSNSFKPPKNAIYKYRLKGLDQNWIKTSTNQVRYPSLPKGSYIFEVKAINEDGVESIKESSIHLHVLPPFWYSWWFYFSIGIGLIGCISLFFSFYIKKIKRENLLVKEKQELELLLVNSKLVALRAQMNPHFIFNALNSIQEYILTNKKELASGYLATFANLMRIYLDHSRKDHITLEEEIDALQKYLKLEKVRFEDSFHYSIHVQDQEIFPEFYKIPSLLIQPYVENALKHGLLHKKEDKKLSIRFRCCTEEKDIIICEIEDNGVGRAYTMKRTHMVKHNSFASDAGKTRLDLLNHRKKQQINMQITDLKKDNIPLGTKVTLKIPYIKKQKTLNHEPIDH